MQLLQKASEGLRFADMRDVKVFRPHSAKPDRIAGVASLPTSIKEGSKRKNEFVHNAPASIWSGRSLSKHSPGNDVFSRVNWDNGEWEGHTQGLGPQPPATAPLARPKEIFAARADLFGR